MSPPKTWMWTAAFAFAFAAQAQDAGTAAPANPPPAAVPAAANAAAAPVLPAVYKLRGRVEAKLLASPDSGMDRASMAVLKFAPNGSVNMHVHTVGEIVYVLSGEVTVTDPNPDKSMVLLEGRMAYLAPGAVHGLASKPGGELLVLWAPAGPEETLKGKRDEATKNAAASGKDAPRAMRGDPNPARYKLGDQLTVQVIFDKVLTKDGSASLSKYIVAGSGQVSPHRHPREAEAFYILSGEAEFDFLSKKRQHRAGDVVYIPPGAMHAIKSTRSDPLVMLQYFVPSPEKRFGGAKIKE